MAGLKCWMQGRVCGGWCGMITCLDFTTVFSSYAHYAVLSSTHGLCVRVWTSLWDKMSCRQRSVRYETWPDHEGFLCYGPEPWEQIQWLSESASYLVWGHQLDGIHTVDEVRWKDHCGPAILEKNSSSIRDCRVRREFGYLVKQRKKQSRAE